MKYQKKSGKTIIEDMFNMVEIQKFDGYPIAGFSNVKEDYYCICRDCGIAYYGDKRSWQCRPCAVISVKNMIENSLGGGI